MTRGVDLLGVHVEDGEPVLTLLCDCATITAVTVAGAASVGSAEFAYTCDGCESSHWVKVQTGETP